MTSIKMQYSPSGQINQTIFTQQKESPFQPPQQQHKSNNDLSQFSPLQLQTTLQHHKNKSNNNHTPNPMIEQDQIQFINSNSIVKRYQLLLITCLIMASIASVKFSNQGSFIHIKTIRDYFNSQILGNSNRAIYEYGDNIDQSYAQFGIFEDVNQHLDDIVGVINNFTQHDGFTYYEKPQSNNIMIEVFYLNGTYQKNQTDLEGFEDFLFSIDRRKLLLSIKEMEFSISFGKNKRIQDLNLTISYDISSRMMLNVELQIYYTPNHKFNTNYNDSTIRVIQQLLAFLLLCSYLHNAYTIKLQNTRLKKLDLFIQDIKVLQKNRAYWCYSLAFLNIVTMLNQTYAPLASFLQLLPIFQRNDSASVYKYNFNTNLRYALPIVMRIFIPVVILLNGFIFYSMLMYPGDYFENYTMGLFSYVYQNFQVGTYEIFIQLESRGNFAYFLYGILYFYMVLVGSNLLPALFCTMIYIKIYQNDLKDHINKTIKTAICPKCNHQNLSGREEQKQFEINIQSPKISPYLKGKLSTVSNKSQLNLISKVTQMFVQTEQVNHDDQKLYLKSKIQKIKTLSQKLQTIIKQTGNPRQQGFFKQQIQKLIQQIQQIVILSPIKLPLRRR